MFGALVSLASGLAWEWKYRGKPVFHGLEGTAMFGARTILGESSAVFRRGVAFVFGKLVLRVKLTELHQVSVAREFEMMSIPKVATPGTRHSTETRQHDSALGATVHQSRIR